MMTFGVPIILLGGGGYNVPNVARCWVISFIKKPGLRDRTYFRQKIGWFDTYKRIIL